MTVLEVYKTGKCLVPRVRELITRMERLLEFASEDIPEDVQLRLFVMTSMSPSFTDILGTALNCPPEVFATHIYSNRFCTKNGCEGTMPDIYRTCTNCGAELCRPVQAASTLNPLPKPYFSLPFKRPILYGSEEKQWHHYVPRKLILERLSGTMYQRPNLGKHIGKLRHSKIRLSRSSAES